MPRGKKESCSGPEGGCTVKLFSRCSAAGAAAAFLLTPAALFAAADAGGIMPQAEKNTLHVAVLGVLFLLWVAGIILLRIHFREISHIPSLGVILVIVFLVVIIAPRTQSRGGISVLSWLHVLWTGYAYWIVLMRLFIKSSPNPAARRADIQFNLAFLAAVLFASSAVIRIPAHMPVWLKGTPVAGYAAGIFFVSLPTLWLAAKAVWNTTRKAPSPMVSRGMFAGLAAAVMASLFFFLPLGLARYVLYPEMNSPHVGMGRVSRVRADMRALATAIEAYAVDQSAYPPWTDDPALAVDAAARLRYPSFFEGVPTFPASHSGAYFSLTTPVAYLSNYLFDPLSAPGATFAYYSCIVPHGGPPAALSFGWILWSPGPDGEYDLNLDNVRVYYNPEDTSHESELFTRFAWDPTNGTMSRGDIIRIHQ